MLVDNRQGLQLGQGRYLKLLSGQTGGAAATALRGVLWIASQFYRVAVAIRNAMFDLGLRESRRVSVPVISIGNITTGGTGKTPFVALVTEILQGSGHRPGIISRGYGADASGENDEKRVLDRLNPGVPHLQNPSRIRSAQTLIESGSVDALVMDDGFQHRSLDRDLDIVLIDACNPFGFDGLLPRGLLREPASALRRADCVLITRCDLVKDPELQAIEAQVLSAGGPGKDRIFRTRFVPVRLMSADGRVRQLSDAAGSRCWLLSGIGNPSAFKVTCELAGLHSVGDSIFNDHHLYSESELNSVLASARSHSADFIVTTLKDLVKIPAFMSEIWAIDIRPVFESAQNEAAFQKLLQDVVAKKFGETDCSSPLGTQ